MPSEVVDLFTELAAIASPPGEERPVADAVARYLRDLGLTVDEDEAGATVGSNMGNLYCRVEPSGNGGTPIFLCAHLDTVPPFISSREDNESIYGRGACDAKGIIAAQIEAGGGTTYAVPADITDWTQA